MQCDSDFGQISRLLKGNLELFTLPQFIDNVFKKAVKNCSVVKVERTQFMDFKQVTNYMSIKKKDLNDEEIKFNRMREWRFIPGDEHLYFRYDHSDDNWRKMLLLKPRVTMQSIKWSSDLFPGIY